MPFLVDMARLYEQFVAEWLKTNLSEHFTVKAQEPIDNKAVKAVIDLALIDVETGATHAVLDTKYKLPQKPANDDIYQVVAYAKARQCQQAILIYPAPLTQPLDTMWDDIRVRSLTFALDGSESENETRNRTSISTTEWLDNGQALRISSESNFSRGERDFTMHSETTWSIEENELILDSIRSTPRGEREHKMVFIKATE